MKTGFRMMIVFLEDGSRTFEMINRKQVDNYLDIRYT